MTKVGKISAPAHVTVEILSETIIPAGTLFSKKIFKKFADMKKCCIFAPNLSMHTTIQALFMATFFIFANPATTGCCSLTGSRYNALLSCANDRVQQSFFINTFLFSQMHTTSKTVIGSNQSPKTRPTVRKLTPQSDNAVIAATEPQPAAEKQAARQSITVTITGANIRYIHAIRKAVYEFMQEETRLLVFSELRLLNKIRAARLLFRDDRKALQGLTVKIK